MNHQIFINLFSANSNFSVTNLLMMLRNTHYTSCVYVLYFLQQLWHRCLCCSQERRFLIHKIKDRQKVTIISPLKHNLLWKQAQWSAISLCHLLFALWSFQSMLTSFAASRISHLDWWNGVLLSNWSCWKWCVTTHCIFIVINCDFKNFTLQTYTKQTLYNMFCHQLYRILELC